MKRLISVLLAMLLLSVPALAEGLLPFAAYARELASFAEADWQGEGDVRVLALEESATLTVCLRAEDVVAVTLEAPKDGLTEAVLRAALEPLAAWSEEALRSLLEAETGVDLTDAGCAVGTLAGEMREGVYAAPEEELGQLLWMPVHGGGRLHSSARCSGMDVPRLVTREAGEALGYTACGHCMAAD